MSNPFFNSDEYRLRAQARRNRGLHTGKQAAGWKWKRPDPEKGSFERVRAEIKARLRHHWASVLADYQAAAFPDREIPF
jgi:hypothetical protein